MSDGDKEKHLRVIHLPEVTHFEFRNALRAAINAGITYLEIGKAVGTDPATAQSWNNGKSAPDAVVQATLVHWVKMELEKRKA